MTNPLPGLMDGINRSIERKGACPLCRSSVHPDGSISHDEDCGVPNAERWLAAQMRPEILVLGSRCSVFCEGDIPSPGEVPAIHLDGVSDISVTFDRASKVIRVARTPAEPPPVNRDPRRRDIIAAYHMSRG